LCDFVFLVGGEEFADRGFISPFWAMWAANVFFGVLGFYLLWLQKQELRIIHFAHFKEVLKKCLIFSKKKL